MLFLVFRTLAMKNIKCLMVLVCVSLTIDLSVVHYFFRYPISHLKISAYIYRDSHHGNTQCTDILSQITNGHWRKRNDISNFDLVNRDQMDLYIRQSILFPLRLTRDDSRCGTKFPLEIAGLDISFPRSAMPAAIHRVVTTSPASVETTLLTARAQNVQILERS